MTAMQIFERCKAAESDKRALRERITRYRESATRMSTALDGIGARSTAEPDKLSAIMAEIDHLERSIRRRDEEYAAELAAACRLLDMLPETECKNIRTMKSTACFHLDEIPEGMVAALLPSWYLNA